MNHTTHPIEHEDLMAWLDGELSAERAEEIAAHVKTCDDCRGLVEDFRRVSNQLAAWQVEPAPTSLDARVSAALQATTHKKAPFAQAKKFFALRPAWRLSAVAALLLIVAAISIPNLLRSRIASNEASAVSSLRSLNTVCQSYASTYGEFPESLAQLGPGNPPSKNSADLVDGVLARGAKNGYLFTYSPGPPSASGRVLSYTITAHPLNAGKSGQRSFFTDQSGVIRASTELLADAESTPIGEWRTEQLSDKAQLAASRGANAAGEKQAPAQPGPMIVRTGSLALVTKEFDSTRAAIQRIVENYGGFFGQLNVSGEENNGRTLTATLRIPAERLEKAMAELRALGRVKDETQSGEEVTQQHVDLTARLANARATEKRLVEVLQQRTGKVGDVLEVEREIARVRGESEKLDAEQRGLEKQVRFATVHIRVTEDFRAQLEVAPPSTASRLRNAAVEGYKSAVENAIGVTEFLLGAGPSLLLWGLIFFWPARLLWRHLRRATAA
ncbi:MAG TPA: DUF4349 domain-containing protein [Candidatus Acidoferrales bacterium]|nr:DUF4349 domain-containing protein [Candidatus Acidoferrales bacterium]